MGERAVRKKETARFFDWCHRWVLDTEYGSVYHTGGCGVGVGYGGAVGTFAGDPENVPLSVFLDLKNRKK
jgi:hypothetical protein